MPKVHIDKLLAYQLHVSIFFFFFWNWGLLQNDMIQMCWQKQARSPSMNLEQDDDDLRTG